jgi:hypothetical protein
MRERLNTLTRTGESEVDYMGTGLRSPKARSPRAPQTSPRSPPSGSSHPHENSDDVDLTADDWGERIKRDSANTRLKDNELLETSRHSVRYQLSKVVLLFLRGHKLPNPNAHGLSWTAQYQNVMSVLRPNNPALADFIVWSQEAIRKYEVKYPGEDIDIDKALKWESYVRHMKMRNAGNIDNHTQFRDNMKIMHTLMYEWTREENGDGDGATRAGPYTPNTYSDYVANLIAQDANGIGIMVTISKLFEPTPGSATDTAMMGWFYDSAGQCPDAAGAWTTVLDKTNRINSSIA